jgi:UDP-N-acetylglucosamine--N-acetylmuramyl-(pentapeptide) pyrophosphoryl-undecaprenol N-acetylglucosamine transferase
LTGPVLIAAGGTGGHMFPALALAAELARRGRAVSLVVDARGARYVQAGMPVNLVTAASPSGSVLQRLVGMARLAIGLVQCLGLIRRLRPVAAACFGGYASFPAALAARLLGRPVLVHEQNAVLGRANRLAGRFADRIALSFAETAAADGLRAPVIVTGNPVRDGFARDPHSATARAVGAPLRLLVIGGSQGARVFSDVLPQAFAQMTPVQRARFAVAQQCRPEDLERVRAAYAALGMAVELQAFFADVAGRMAAADLVVTRSGASTVAELLALARPSLLVPYRHAADDHQRANAERLAAAGAALMLPETELEPARLARMLDALEAAPARLAAMADAAARLARPDAAAALADAVLELGAGGPAR